MTEIPKPKIRKVRYKGRVITGINKILTYNEAKYNRNVYCPYYDDCLDVAVAYGMKSFICTNCKYKHTKLIDGEIIEEVPEDEKSKR